MNSAGSLYLYNFTPVHISAVVVNGGASLGTVPAMQGQAIGAPLLLDRTPFTAAGGAPFVVTFSGGNQYGATLTVSAHISPSEFVQLMCSWNAFFCTDQFGNFIQGGWS